MSGHNPKLGHVVVGIGTPTTTHPISVQQGGSVFARIDRDGATFFDWPLLQTVAAKFHPDEPRQAEAIAYLVWCAANPGIKP